MHETHESILSVQAPATPTLSDATLQSYLQLARTPTIGPITFQRLMQLYPSPQEALAALPELAARGGRKSPLKIASRDEVKREIDITREHGGQYLICGEDGYPEALSHIADPPIALAVHGHVSLLGKPTLAIVGSRNASAAGQKITETLSHELSGRGLVIASGLARGIDAAAHGQALNGGTIAVLGNGITHAYPRENTDLQKAILSQGLVASENHPNSQPQAAQFPRRNRIISGLSLGVIIVEAARRSGSLITARLANEQGREVMAVPGSPLDARCHGSNNLLREGAHLIETADDVLNIIQPLLEVRTLRAKPSRQLRLQRQSPRSLTSQKRSVITRLLGPVPITIDELVTRSNEPVPIVYLAILELQLAGRLTQDADGKISLLET